MGAEGGIRMLSALIFAAALQGTRTVTFSHPCAHSSVVLEALGEELGLILKPSGSVNNDYFLVRFDDVDVETVFEKISEILTTTWTKEGDVYYLGRTRKQDNQDKAKDDEPLLRAHRMFVEKTLAPPAFTT
ncbi:MAG: hypothetical protein IIC73_06330, partial [Armatimonadetes bacterium]|nr:hypothetical protein [Armatimonadota bacterium]